MSDNLLNEFIFDSRDHLSAASAQLLALENDPASLASMNALMGTLHTLKGNSGILDLNNFYKLMHHAESLIQTLKERQAECPPAVIDLLLQVLDTAEATLSQLENNGTDAVDWLETLNQALNEAGNQLESGDSAPPAAAAASPAAVENTETPAPAAGAERPLLTPLDQEGNINLWPLADGDLARAGDTLPAQVEALFQAGLGGLVVDLRGLASLTSRELKLLWAASRKKTARTVFVLDQAGQPDLARLFRVLDLDRKWPLFPGPEPALAHLKAEA